MLQQRKLIFEKKSRLLSHISGHGYEMTWQKVSINAVYNFVNKILSKITKKNTCRLRVMYFFCICVVKYKLSSVDIILTKRRDSDIFINLIDRYLLLSCSQIIRLLNNWDQTINKCSAH